MAISEPRDSQDSEGCANNWVFYALLLAVYLPYLAIFWFLSTNPHIFSEDEAKGLFGYALLGILVMSGVLFAYSFRLPQISMFYRDLLRKQPYSVAIIFIMMGLVGILAIYFAWPLSSRLGKNIGYALLFVGVLFFAACATYRVRQPAVAERSDKNNDREISPQSNRTS